jgi:hypothetical protein
LIDGFWTQTAKLLAADGGVDHFFGSSVAIAGEQLLVGARGSGSGAVYGFERISGQWTQVQKIEPRSASSLAWFGEHIDARGDLLLVGAQFDYDGQRRASTGAAFVFERQEDGRWVEVAKLLAADRREGDQLGRAVGIDGDIAVLGAKLDHRGADAGGAYVFERDAGGVWREITKLFAADAMPDDAFGVAVTVEGTTALIGAVAADSGPAFDTGAVYRFTRDSDGTWRQTAKLVARDAAPGDQFGWSISLADGLLMVGAPRDDINGPDSGAAYIFELERCGDIDGDGDVDLDDHARFHECLTGPSGGVRAICAPADLDRDDDVDLSDYRFLQPSLSGPS